MHSHKRNGCGLRMPSRRDSSRQVGRFATSVIYLIIVFLVFTSQGVGAADVNARGPVEICLEANKDSRLRGLLPRITNRMNSGGLLTIVAVGSSSTVGLWVLSSKATYPAKLEQELAKLRPRSQIKVINSGQVGDTIARSVSRFDRDVLIYKPDLVIWQLGTNDVAWGGNTLGLRGEVLNGVNRLKSIGADVILMDQQYSPQVLSSPAHAAMQDIISDVARQENVGLFSRFELMRKSLAAGLSINALVAFDGLHNSAEGYDCIGRALARMISKTVPSKQRYFSPRKV